MCCGKHFDKYRQNTQKRDKSTAVQFWEDGTHKHNGGKRTRKQIKTGDKEGRHQAEARFLLQHLQQAQ